MSCAPALSALWKQDTDSLLNLLTNAVFLTFVRERAERTSCPRSLSEAYRYTFLSFGHESETLTIPQLQLWMVAHISSAGSMGITWLADRVAAGRWLIRRFRQKARTEPNVNIRLELTRRQGDVGWYVSVRKYGYQGRITASVMSEHWEVSHVKARFQLESRPQ